MKTSNITQLLVLSLLLMSLNIQSQNFNNIFDTIDNYKIAPYAKLYEKLEFVQPEGVEGVDYFYLPSVLGGPILDHVKIEGLNADAMNTLVNQIRDNPSVINGYLNSTTHDFSSVILLLHIYEYELINSAERVCVSGILFYLTQPESYINNLIQRATNNINSRNDIFNHYWLRIKNSLTNRIKDLINAQYPPEKHIIYPAP